MATSGTTDCLDRDPPLRRQKFACVSLLTPSDVDVRRREYFEARAFAMDRYPKDFPTQADYDGAFSDWAAEIQTDLDDDFKREAKGKPHIPIMKIRGCFKTRREAEERCHFLAKTDKTCDIWVATVGAWLPADGKRREDETALVYAEQKMQDLMQSRKKSQLFAKEVFEKRKQAAIDQAQMEKNKPGPAEAEEAKGEAEEAKGGGRRETLSLTRNE